MHQSISTIDSPEFVNLQPLDLNPLMSKCEIKVLYIGENRNHSFITKEVAAEMSKTLRGAPIVGYYKKDKEDFADHGEKVVIDDEGIKFECMTQPYGFVAPDAQVWFQTFEDYDDFGNATKREYLMTTGYLWTGQFEECKDAIVSGKPQSMELDEDTLDGFWSTNTKSGIDFFIINDAIFSKLCILGEDVEPCFEGASVTAPNVSNTFSMDDTFKNTLFTMMQDLKNFVLEGGQHMENLETTVVEETTEFVAEETQDNVVENDTPETQNFTEESEVASDFEIEEAEPEAPAEEFAAEEVVEEAEVEVEAEQVEEVEVDYAAVCGALKEQLESLQNQYACLEQERNELFAFKEEVINGKKDALIDSFYMLSDEDKADVIANKASYSLDDIEAKLSVICVRKKVNFNLDETKENVTAEKSVVTYNLEQQEAAVPAYIQAIRAARNNNI